MPVDRMEPLCHGGTKGWEPVVVAEKPDDGSEDDPEKPMETRAPSSGDRAWPPIDTPSPPAASQDRGSRGAQKERGVSDHTESFRLVSKLYTLCIYMKG